MSVSPVDRTAMAASTLDSSTASTVIQGGISNRNHAVITVSSDATPRPTIHQLFGIMSVEVSAAAGPRAVLRKVSSSVRQLMARLVRASATMIATPGHRIQPRAPSA